MSSPKRRKMDDSQPSTGQQPSVPDAASPHSQIIERVKAAGAQRGQIAWSRHSLIAHASSSETRSHIILRSLAHLSASDQAHKIRPCQLYPPADPVTSSQLFGTGPGPSAPAPIPVTEYASPQHITFSHCGFFLTAYFPLKDPSKSELVQNDASQLTERAPSLMSRTSTSGINDVIAQASATTPLGLHSLSATLLKSVTPTGKLCIWSRAKTGPLNDWILIQSIPVRESPEKDQHSATLKDNALKVNAEGQQIETDSGKDSDDANLVGGIRNITWLSGKRKWIVCTDGAESPYEREASRGPCFLNSEEIAGPHQDQALLVFGNQGQVSLLHSKQFTSSLPGSATPFQLLQSNLFSPALRPVPPTLEPEVSDTSPSAEQMDTMPDLSSFQKEEIELSHLAVGMSADEPILLVASKTDGPTETSLHLTEITIDLQGDNVTMVTRPLERLPLISTWTGMEGQVLDTEVGLNGSSVLTSLEWVDVHNKQTTGPSLKLMAAFTQPVPDIASSSTAPDSFVKVWDIVQDEDELSEAFQTLECRKGGEVPNNLEWRARVSITKTLETTTVLDLHASRSTLPVSNVVVASMLVASQEAHGGKLHYKESIQCLDTRNLETIGAAGAVPPKAIDRSSSLVLSPNGLLVAALSKDPSIIASMKAMVWKLPTPVLGETSEVETVGKLCGLTLLRRSDSNDIARSLFTTDKDSEFIISALQETAKALGMASRPSSVKAEEGVEQNPKQRQPSFVQVLRLLELQLSIIRGRAKKGNGDSELLVLELALCHELLRHSRITGQRTYYRLDSVWSIIAQLQWLLNVIDGIGKIAVLSTGDNDKDEPIVRLLTFQTPRRLLVQILRNMSQFKAWLLSTTEKENLPPPTFGSGVIAISDQLELARDALRYVLVGSSVDLEATIRVFAKLEEESTGDNDEYAWWSFGLKTGRLEEQRKLLSSLIDPTSGSLIDCLTLFISPSDLLNERTVLASSQALTNKQQERDIIRKTLIKPQQGRKKVCLRCAAVSQDVPGSTSEMAQSFMMRCICGGLWWVI